MIRYVEGDATGFIVTGGPKLLLHICNDTGARWGKGFVKSLAQAYPEAHSRYTEWTRGQTNDPPYKLGNIQIVQVRKKLAVVNMVAQHGLYPSQGRPPIRYNALAKCLAKVREHVDRQPFGERETTIHMPRIGCGLAGGTWEKVSELLRQELRDFHITVYDLPT